MRGSAGMRLRSGVLMAALGGLVSVPASRLQQYVESLDPVVEQARHAKKLAAQQQQGVHKAAGLPGLV